MTVDLESREGSAHVHFRAKYKQADRDRMAKAGQAMSDGSYPIADEEDLGKAIHAVGRGGASHDAIRKHIIARAKALGLSKQIPDNWNADGSLKESNALQPGPGWSVRADGRTFNDVRQAVQAAISDAVGPSLDGSGKEIYVVDLTDQWAVYQVGYSGDYLQVDYTVGADGSVALGKPTKVSQVTSYQPVGRAEGRAVSHEPFTGTHEHAHPAFGSQGGDEGHSHSHSHSNDASHDHHTGDRSLFGAPVQGRSERGELHHSPESRFMTFADAECRMESAGNGMTFRGYASIFDAPYPIHDAYGEYQETVSRGAFDTSIAQGADVVFLVNHDGAPLARTKSGTLSIRTDQKGLLTEARLDPANPRAQDLKSMVERGDMDEMSFTFRDMRPSWNDTWTERNFREVSLHHGDVSTVNFGANGATKGTLAMRSLGNRLLLPSTRQFAESLLEIARRRRPVVDGQGDPAPRAQPHRLGGHRRRRSPAASRRPLGRPEPGHRPRRRHEGPFGDLRRRVEARRRKARPRRAPVP